MKARLLISVLCIGIIAGCAAQKDVTSLDTRLSEIELREAQERRRLETTAQTREEQEQMIRRQTATLRAEIEQLREELRLINGRLEEVEYSLKQQKGSSAENQEIRSDTVAALDEKTRRQEERLNRLETYLNLEAGSSQAVIPAGGTASKIKPGQPLGDEDLYRTAKQAFDQGDLEAARQGFEELIQRYPQSKHADNSQFWIGEIYYRDKWYEKAILEYQKVIENYPNGNKVPASLLKQGFAFQNIGDNANARLILEELTKKYPQSNEAKIASEKLKNM
jgi:tol-pal system protein YbgF